MMVDGEPLDKKKKIITPTLRMCRVCHGPMKLFEIPKQAALSNP